MTQGLKQRLTTYSEKAVEFFAGKGAKIKLLYKADGVGCYEVTLRGRKQCKLLRHEDYLGISAEAVFDAYRIAAARLKPPLYTLRVGGFNAIMEDHDSAGNYFVLTRDPDMLVQSIREPADVVSLTSWEEIDAFVKDAETENIPLIRVFIGYGPHSKLPYRESYDVTLLKLVTARMLAPPGVPNVE